jgi:hypothetical protein
MSLQRSTGSFAAACKFDDTKCDYLAGVVLLEILRILHAASSDVDIASISCGPNGQVSGGQFDDIAHVMLLRCVAFGRLLHLETADGI